MSGADLDWTLRVRVAVRACLGQEPERIVPLDAGLGLRRFARVLLPAPPGRLIARVDAPEDAAGRPPGIPPEPPLEPVRALFEAGGLPVPRRLGADADAGIELLEDAGERSLARAVRDASPDARRALYRRVCAWIPRIQALRDPGGLPAFRRRLEAAHFAYKADLFCRHSLVDPSPARLRQVHDAFATIGREALAAPQRLAHRDLQAENVMVREDASGEPRLALIDLQGALCTAPEYDLVSLLRDSYVELPEQEIREHFERTRAALPDPPDAESAARRFDLLTLTRKGKDHARFLYAAASRGDRRWLACVPTTVRHLRAAAAAAARRDPAFAALAEIVHELPERAGDASAPDAPAPGDASGGDACGR